MKHDHLSKSALIAIFALVVLSLIGGWIIILQSLQQTKTLQVIAVAGVSIPPAIYWLA